MNIELKNDLLNLPKLQLQIDTIVFDYIDSKPNWSKAYEQLDALLHKVAHNFNGYITRNEGAMPKASTYWTIYMDVVSKLLYFTSLAQSHLITEQDQQAKAQIIERYKISASCLPNPTIEENEEFIDEVKKSLQQLTGQDVVLATSNKTELCFESFYSYTKSKQ